MKEARRDDPSPIIRAVKREMLSNGSVLKSMFDYLYKFIIGEFDNYMVVVIKHLIILISGMYIGALLAFVGTSVLFKGARLVNNLQHISAIRYDFSEKYKILAQWPNNASLVNVTEIVIGILMLKLFKKSITIANIKRTTMITYIVSAIGFVLAVIALIFTVWVFPTPNF